MLSLPTTGISRSVTTHNVKLDVLCDWIESNILFDEEELSFVDVVSCLLAGQIYDDSDMASEVVSDAWTELRRRQSWISNSTPFDISSQRITRKSTWRRFPAHSFCLLLSLAKWYRGWASQQRNDYNLQGELFEKLIGESLAQQFKNWEILLTGWSRTTPQSLGTIVEKVASSVGESVGNLTRWTSENANDAELDLLLCRPFNDKRTGIPVYLMQCASGANWTEKLHTPRLELWTKAVDFAVTPKRAFAMPFALLDREFSQKCLLVNGLFIDRYRILANNNSFSSELKKGLKNWAAPRIKTLPTL